MSLRVSRHACVPVYPCSNLWQCLPLSLSLSVRQATATREHTEDKIQKINDKLSTVSFISICTTSLIHHLSHPSPLALHVSPGDYLTRVSSGGFSLRYHTWCDLVSSITLRCHLVTTSLRYRLVISTSLKCHQVMCHLVSYISLRCHRVTAHSSPIHISICTQFAFGLRPYIPFLLII